MGELDGQGEVGRVSWVRYGIDMMWLPGRARRENARILFFLTTHGTYGWMIAWLQAHACALVGIGMPLSSSAAVRRHDPGRGLGGSVAGGCRSQS
jgi:hypothetical protein